MSQQIVLKSFEELADLFPEEEVQLASSEDADGDTSSFLPNDDDCANLANLCRQLEAAGVALARIIVRDQQERERAARDLERYDALVRQQHEAEHARSEAGRVRQEAEAFAELAYAESARAEAAQIALIARRAEDIAAAQVESWREDAERLAAELNLERLLEVRRREEEIAQEKAAAAERARRLDAALARARSALDAGQVAEARGLTAFLSSEDPGNPEIASFQGIIARRELAVKVAAAEELIQIARRDYRRDPGGVVRCLAAFDLEGLPADLRRQVFGEWARACSRLCHDRGLVEPLRYAPDPGRGAVLARESADRAYVVVSSLAMGPAWREGEVVDERQVRRARPLR